MEQPPGYDIEHPKMVCKLNKALYDLKQSPGVWYNHFADHLKELGLEPIDADSSVLTDTASGVIIALYVDDVLVTGSS